MSLLWQGVMLTLAYLFGYFPARLLSLGADLSASVARQWAGWWTSDLKRSDGAQSVRVVARLGRCRRVRGGAFVLSFTDDAFATEADAGRLLSYFPSPSAQLVRGSRAQIGRRSIGHFGFFRRNAQQPIRPKVLARILQCRVSRDVQQTTVVVE
jgi:predicted alpha/beta hydrolase